MTSRGHTASEQRQLSTALSGVRMSARPHTIQWSVSTARARTSVICVVARLSRSMARLDELAEAKEALSAEALHAHAASLRALLAPMEERNVTGGITTRLNGTRTRRSRMPRSWD